MRKFRYIGTEKQAKEYDCGDGKFPLVGHIYTGDTLFGTSSESSVKSWACWARTEDQWEEVFGDKISTDPVNPQHYKNGGVECIEAIKSAVVGKDGFAGYLVGNLIKYVWRYESKGGVEDLEKGSWYLNKLIEHEKSKK